MTGTPPAGGEWVEVLRAILDNAETAGGAEGRAETVGAVGAVLLSRSPGGAFMDEPTVAGFYSALTEISGLAREEVDSLSSAARAFKTSPTPVTTKLRGKSSGEAYAHAFTLAVEHAAAAEPVDLSSITAARLIIAAQNTPAGAPRGLSRVPAGAPTHPGGHTSTPSGIVAVEHEEEGKGEVREEAQGAGTGAPQVEKAADAQDGNNPGEDPKEKLARLYAQLDSLVGLTEVKREIRQQVELLRVERLRAKLGLESPDVTRHLVFTGNPGTGKTTVARLVGEIYATIEILRTGQLVEVDKSGLVGGFLGQSEQKTAETIKEALGGVLFVDEAYALVGDDYGEAVIDILVKAAEDNRDSLVIVLAGYTRPMGELLDTNPGLRSRFRTVVFFPDYTDNELVEIFENMVERSDYVCGAGAVEAFRGMVAEVERDETFGNARWVRNCFEAAMTRHAWRLKDVEEPSLEQLRELSAEDITGGSTVPADTTEHQVSGGNSGTTINVEHPGLGGKK